MQDIVNIKSEFIKDIISGLISNLLKNKKDINIDIHLDEFHVENYSGIMSIYINMSAEMPNEDLNTILKKFRFFKDIILSGLNKKFIHKIIKKFFKKRVDIKINELSCSNKDSGPYLRLNANAKMSDIQLQTMLVDCGLLD